MKPRLEDARRWPPHILWCPGCREYWNVRNANGFLIEHRCFKHLKLAPSRFMELALMEPPVQQTFATPRAPQWR